MKVAQSEAEFDALFDLFGSWSCFYGLKYGLYQFFENPFFFITCSPSLRDQFYGSPGAPQPPPTPPGPIKPTKTQQIKIFGGEAKKEKGEGDHSRDGAWQFVQLSRSGD